MRLNIGLAVLTAMTSACAVNSSGCENFDPRSRPLGVGESVPVEVIVLGDRVDTVDVNGGYYVQPDAIKLSMPRRSASASPAQGVVRRQAEGLSLTLEGQTFPLEGPLGCD